MSSSTREYSMCRFLLLLLLLLLSPPAFRRKRLPAICSKPSNVQSVESRILHFSQETPDDSPEIADLEASGYLAGKSTPPLCGTRAFPASVLAHEYVVTGIVTGIG